MKAGRLLAVGILFSTTAAIANELPDVEFRSRPSWESYDAPKMVSTYDKASAAVTVKNTSALEGRLSALESQVSNSSSVQVIQRLEAIQQEMQNLRGLIEEQQYALDGVTKNQRDLYQDLDTRIGQVQQNSVADMHTVNRNPQIADAGPSEKQVYDEAYQLLQSRQYQTAVEKLKSLLKLYPTGAYAPNAMYWIGEVLLVEGQVDDAAIKFNEVIEQFPEHTKSSDALLKLGYVAYAKGDYQKAQGLLEQVSSKFPNSPTARLAEARLQRMKEDGHL